MVEAPGTTAAVDADQPSLLWAGPLLLGKAGNPGDHCLRMLHKEAGGHPRRQDRRGLCSPEPLLALARWPPPRAMQKW